MSLDPPAIEPARTAEKPGVTELAILVAFALLPFLAKAIALMLGATGYGIQSVYKLFQLLAASLWRYRWRQARGFGVVWPTEEPMPSASTWAIAVILAIVLSGSAIALATWLLPHIDIDPRVIRAGLDERFRLGPTGALLVVVFLSLANSGLEELHFRAWLDRELSARWGSAAGVTVSAAAFGAMHILIFLGMPGLPRAAVLIVPCALATAGAAWSMLMRRPGGIHAAWLSHGLTDALLLGWGLHWIGYL
jgi:membrane protease YdiL (CAAX protease family)